MLWCLLISMRVATEEVVDVATFISLIMLIIDYGQMYMVGPNFRQYC